MATIDDNNILIIDDYDFSGDDVSLDYTESGINGVVFHVSNEDIEKSTKFEYMSETVQYYTERIENGSTTFSGYVSEYNYRNGNTPLNMEEFGLWQDTVQHYIDAHNENLENEEANKIRFEITNIDNRSACHYIEYLNDKEIKRGVGWCKDLETKLEKKAWRKAVKQYKEDNGIKTPTKSIKDLMDNVREKLKNSDICNSDLDLKPPIAINAIASLGTDPCQFIPNIKKAFGDVMETIAGLPSPKALLNYYTNLIKYNARELIKCGSNISQIIEEPYIDPLFENIDDSLDYYEQLDSEREEWLKSHPKDEVLLDTCKMNEMWPEIPSYTETDSIEFDGDVGGSFSSEGLQSSLSAAETKIDPELFKKLKKGQDILSSTVINAADRDLSGKIIHRQITDKHREIIHKMKGFENYPNSKLQGGEIVPKGVKNFFINDLQQERYTKFVFDVLLPIRIGWEKYCNQNGWDSTWAISCTYRSPWFNISVNNNAPGTTIGSVTSAHSDGMAFDVQTTLGKEWNNENKKNGAIKLLEFILSYCNKAYQEDKNTIFRFDQCFREVNGSGSSWVHFGWRKSGTFDSPRGCYFHEFKTSGGTNGKPWESGPLWKTV